MGGRRSTPTKSAIALTVLTAIALVLAWPTLIAQTHHYSPRTTPSFDKRPKNDALVKAAGDGDLKTIRKLLDSGVSPNSGSTGEEGVSALSAAASGGRIDAVKLLLTNKADVNADDFWGGGAIIGASLSGHVDVVRLLLAHGADPNMEDDGVTALDYASHQLVDHETAAPIENYRVIVELLKASGGRSGSIMHL